MLTRQSSTQISEALLAKLLEWMKPKRLDRMSTMYDVGYQTAQQDFHHVLQHHLNKTLPAPKQPYE